MLLLACKGMAGASHMIMHLTETAMPLLAFRWVLDRAGDSFYDLAWSKLVMRYKARQFASGMKACTQEASAALAEKPAAPEALHFKVK